MLLHDSEGTVLHRPWLMCGVSCLAYRWHRFGRFWRLWMNFTAQLGIKMQNKYLA